MKRRFEDKVVVVTGASSGIGRAAAACFAREGARLVISARRAELLEQAAAEARAAGGEVLAVPGDVTDRAAVFALVERACAAWGRIDVMVNNAGSGLAARVLETREEDFSALFRVNVLGALHGMQAACARMRRQGGGVIVNVSSVVGRRAMPGNGAYCATKFALEALSDSLRLELGGTGIAVVVVRPGLTATGFHAAALRTGDMTPGGPPGMRGMSAEAAGRALVDATARRQRTRVLTLSAKAVLALERTSPSLTDRIVKVAMRHRL
jgi:NAD(P)-dependent dehydrogenase (short-subunit alcohol dehydrogenase family)